ncbi:hypothetical protein CMO90_03175 [Candidatus Woesearchaeota archaeon]|jgi:7-cyano-7-deazaguanine synthase in queuosine biosynthesis|nr:hypothetical protein [Candidatus Woesearchaeota archaeon]|tara:strand:+ start:2424 stop:3158 length:735 start_codon:yes stop_codon:yes gene_type:complete
MKKAVILFSGGADSTLATALKANEFDEIHLLTFHQQTSFQAKKSKYYLDALKKKFGNKFKHKIIHINKLYKKVLTNNLKDDFKKYHFHMALFICEACRIAMQAATIKYAIKHKIKYVFDGSWKKQDISPEAMKEVLVEIKKLYFEFGLYHKSPVYNYPNKNAIQKKLFELNIADSPKYKCRPLTNTDAYLFPKNQPSCPVGIISVAYSKYIYAPIKGRKRRNLDCKEYYISKKEILKKIINQKN